MRQRRPLFLVSNCGLKTDDYGKISKRGVVCLITVPAKTIVTRKKSTDWFGSEYNMNIYRGCSHGCIYCDSRSDCYGDDNFDTVKVKENALEIINNDLRRKAKTGVVATGAMSDPYNPLEKQLLLTRHALELLNAYGFGVTIATKSDLITRDIDILSEIGQNAPVLCKLTVTTCDDRLAKKIEPHAPDSARRFAAVEQLSSARIFTGILLMPVLPFLEDSFENITGIINRAADCGARFVYPAFGVTLRQNQRAHYLNALEVLFPGQGFKMRYVQRYGNSYECRCPEAAELWRHFTALCDQKGILYNMKDIIRSYRQPYHQQLSLF